MLIHIVTVDEILNQKKLKNFWKPELNLIFLCLGCQKTNVEGNSSRNILKLFDLEWIWKLLFLQITQTIW